MFKFDFQVEESADDAKTLFEPTKTDNDLEASSTVSEWYESEEVAPTEDTIAKHAIYELNSTTMTVGTVEIEYVKSGNLLQTFSNEENTKDITRAEINHSDLIPGVYEGGAKIWECTDDLFAYLSSNHDEYTFDGKRVLDLGCGSGILGLYAFKSGATVHFQDYNKDVLETITIPNTLLNLPEPTLDEFKNVKFYSGDWSKYVALSENDEKFDAIFSSETIYNPQNQKKLLDTFSAKLKTDGTVFVAAKTYYFGVGGGLRQFEELVKDDGRFVSEVVWTSEEGVSREVLVLKFDKKL